MFSTYERRLKNPTAGCCLNPQNALISASGSTGIVLHEVGLVLPIDEPRKIYTMFGAGF